MVESHCPAYCQGPGLHKHVVGRLGWGQNRGRGRGTLPDGWVAQAQGLVGCAGAPPAACPQTRAPGMTSGITTCIATVCLSQTPPFPSFLPPPPPKVVRPASGPASAQPQVLQVRGWGVEGCGKRGMHAVCCILHSALCTHSLHIYTTTPSAVLSRPRTSAHHASHHSFLRSLLESHQYWRGC